MPHGLSEHVDALAALFTVEGHGSDDAPPVVPPLDLTALGPTPQSLTAHQRRPHVHGHSRLF